MKLKGILLLGILLMGLPGCEDEPCGCGQVEDHPVYFEYRYQNWAWGYQDQGWLISGVGYVRGFNLPDGFEDADSAGWITLDALVYNLGMCDTIMDRVPRDDMIEYVDLIPGAAEGEIGEARNIAADAGTSVLSAYMYDAEEDMYKKVFLGQSGDWEQFNLSSEAETLVEWLKEFGVFWLSE